MKDFDEPVSDSNEPITRDMLEDSFRQIQNDINNEAPSMLMKATYTIGICVVIAVCLAYVFGRRIGRKRSTVVEIRRL